MLNLTSISTRIKPWHFDNGNTNYKDTNDILYSVNLTWFMMPGSCVEALI